MMTRPTYQHGDRFSSLGLAALCTLGVVAVHSAAAQVIELRGGQSSIYQAGGGGMVLHTKDSDLEVGAGVEAGRVISGARYDKTLGIGHLTLGDDQINFTLPTDIFGSSPYLFTRGASIRTQTRNTDVLLFTGVESNIYSTPLFTGGTSGALFGFVSVHQRLGDHWQLYSDTVFSSKQSEIIALKWRALDRTEISVSGGIGSNHPYGAASVDLERRWLDLKASYVQAGKDFQRIKYSSPNFAEPNKGSILVTIHPWRFLSLFGGTQSYLIPEVSADARYTGETAASSAAQVGASLNLAKYVISGTLYSSKYLGHTDHAGTVSVQHSLSRRIQVTSSWMASRPKDSASSNSLLLTVNEKINARFSVNQSVSISNGTENILYGGAVDSNLISISANYESFYVPALVGSPFENALLLNLNVHLFGRLQLHGETFVGPTGRLLYTSDAYAMASRDAADVSSSTQAHSIEGTVLHGQVVDDMGVPVEGAALMIDQSLMYTDSNGRFFMREHKPRTHTLTVLVDQFLTGNAWRLVTAPTSIHSSEDEAETGSFIIVHQQATVVAARSQVQPAGN